MGAGLAQVTFAGKFRNAGFCAAALAAGFRTSKKMAQSKAFTDISSVRNRHSSSGAISLGKGDLNNSDVNSVRALSNGKGRGNERMV